MAIDEKLLKSVIAEVLKEMNTADTSAASAVEGETYECPGMQITEIGDAEKGTNPNEVVLGLAPAFGDNKYRRYSSCRYCKRGYGWSGRRRCFL